MAWAEDIGHMWRISGDIVNCWDCELSHGNWSAWGLWPIIRMRQNIRQYNGPGHWNDLDMMEVGNGFTAAEDRVHFTMWCILSSPLVLGNDVRSMNKETRDLLTNKEVIAINQDSLGVQGFRFMNENDIEIWVKALANDEWAIAFVNIAMPKIQSITIGQNIRLWMHWLTELSILANEHIKFAIC